MKVCIKEDKLNWNYHLVYGEEKTIEDGYKIIEIPDGYGNCSLEDFDANGFNVELYNQRKQKENNAVRIEELDNWFKTDYAKYEQMFNRRHFLAIEDVIVDEFRGKSYHNLGELYREGEDVAKEIRELKEKCKLNTVKIF